MTNRKQKRAEQFKSRKPDKKETPSEEKTVWQKIPIWVKWLSALLVGIAGVLKSYDTIMEHIGSPSIKFTPEFTIAHTAKPHTVDSKHCRILLLGEIRNNGWKDLHTTAFICKLTTEYGVEVPATLNLLLQDTLSFYMSPEAEAPSTVSDLKKDDINNITFLKPGEEQYCAVNIYVEANLAELTRQHTYTFKLTCIATDGREYNSESEIHMVLERIGHDDFSIPHFHLDL